MMPTARVSAAAFGSDGSTAVQPRLAPGDRGDEHFDQVAKPDHADEGADDEFDRAEAAALEQQNAIGDHGR